MTTNCFLLSMQTPHLPKTIFGDDFKDVYEPAEDTFLLLDALENDLHLLKSDAKICLECGSGSGAVITALSIALKETVDKQQVNNTMNRLMFATDINPKACKMTRKCANYHKQLQNIEVIRTDLARALVDRLQGSVDVLIFNPPYVPTGDDEHFSQSKDLQLSWAGGENGRKLIDTFLSDHVALLLSKPSGVAYMVALDENKINDLLAFLRPQGISGSVVIKRRAGSELLHVIKYQWIGRAKANR